ncbi:MAG TPA: hypothetical protein VFV86_10215 [Nitrososphaeraceae archaeon]|nr:hypothetical protein [Nitrososphaeraceae archaeon]
MFVAENFIRSLVEKYDKHTVYTDGGTWYPQAFNFLHLKHRLHSPLKKSLVERDAVLRIELRVLTITIHVLLIVVLANIGYNLIYRHG